MSESSSMGYAFNRTRLAYLATELRLARTHWTRFRGLMGAKPEQFADGAGLWIVPCHGVHTFAMNFPIDALYLDSRKAVVHIEQNLQPWRMGRVSARTTSVLELPVNTLSGTGTRVGDEIEISLAASRPAVMA